MLSALLWRERGNKHPPARAPPSFLSCTGSLSFQLHWLPEWPMGVFGKKAQAIILNMASMNLFCTILCICLQLQALFGTKEIGLGSYLHCINFLSNHVALEPHLCLLHISVSQGISEAKATLQSQLKGVGECVNICVFPFFPHLPS